MNGRKIILRVGLDDEVKKVREVKEVKEVEVILILNSVGVEYL